ncbi:MAG TPA: penicillin-binding transpeptidase domain-containing protein [Gemmatimonadales bacterium]|nr:penicillin-binding transpeptidase domain-containing protein [Gemmatimonadales bacterium]
MARVKARILFLEIGLALAVAAVLARAAQLQIVQGPAFAARAAEDRRVRVVLPARRGLLLDRNGTSLAVTQESYHVGIAPDQVTDRQALVQQATLGLGISAPELNRQLSSRKYLYFHGPFTAVQIQPIRRMKGVHLEAEYRRFYPGGDLARPIIGGFNSDSDHGSSGLELALDSLLTGIPGADEQLKDRAGRRYESPSRRVRDPVPGDDVVLTLDAELQDIAQQGLADAVQGMKALGGDAVFLDPRTGEVLALASIRREPDQDLAAAPTTITEPFQPGSTAKLFTAAALLTQHLVDSSDRVYAENGVWEMPIGTRGRTRTIHDAHAVKGSLTLAQAIQVSSNIAMAKFSTRLSSERHFEALRDFGFGSPTGVEFPMEARGTLDRPDHWEAGYSGPSLAMGYELAITPLQLAVAYGAIANNGVLLAPTLVKEIRDPQGKVLYRHSPEPVRRVLTPEVTARLREYLHGAVGEGGTGDKAQLVNYTLVGKTGTAKRFEKGHYVEGSYTASFAALFPTEDPRLVVVVKIDDPKGEYYGGLTAAPVTRRMLDQALAARTIAIDRSRFASRAAPDSTPREPHGESESVANVVLRWPVGTADSQSRLLLPVPNTLGTPTRKAVLALHRRGFEVDLRGQGTVTRTSPAPGDSALTGGSVTVWAE